MRLPLKIAVSHWQAFLSTSTFLFRRNETFVRSSKDRKFFPARFPISFRFRSVIGRVVVANSIITKCVYVCTYSIRAPVRRRSVRLPSW